MATTIELRQLEDLIDSSTPKVARALRQVYSRLEADLTDEDVDLILSGGLPAALFLEEWYRPLDPILTQASEESAAGVLALLPLIGGAPPVFDPTTPAIPASHTALSSQAGADTN